MFMLLTAELVALNSHREYLAENIPTVQLHPLLLF